MLSIRSPIIWFVLVVLGAILIAQALILQRQAADERELETLQATVLRQPRPISDFSLVDHRQQTFDLTRLQGKWSFLFFGYTNCPDVCPNTMTVLNLVDKDLRSTPQSHKDTQVVFVSVDPSRDSVAQLNQYVPYFNKEFLGVTENTAGQIDTLTKQLGILAMRVPQAQEQDSYLVEHSASIVLIDPQAKLHALFSAPHDPQVLASEFRKIRGIYERRS